VCSPPLFPILILIYFCLFFLCVLSLWVCGSLLFFNVFSLNQTNGRPPVLPIFYALRGVLHLAVIGSHKNPIPPHNHQPSGFVPPTIFLSLYVSTKCRGSIYRTRHNTNFKYNIGANPCACTVCLSFGFALFIFLIANS